MPRPLVAAIAFALILLGASAGHAERGPVGIVAHGDENNYSDAVRVAIELGRQIEASGRNTLDALSLQQSPVGAAAGALDLARRALKAGITHYDSLDFAKAREAFQGAVRLFREAILHGAPGEDYVLALHYWAASAFYDNDRQSASKLFIEAAAYAPAQRMNESIFSPDVVTSFDEAKGTAVTPGSLDISSAPASMVEINGKPAGATPLLLDRLLPGHYLLRFRRAGYAPTAQWLVVGPGSLAKVRMELRQSASLPGYERGVASAVRELDAGMPGNGIETLCSLLGVRSLILVVGGAEGVRAGWAEGGRFTMRHSGAAGRGQEEAFAATFFSGAMDLQPVALECRRDQDCSGGKECRGGKCLPRASPFYKSWWFWTVVGAAVAGGAAAGIVLGTRQESWTMELAPQIGFPTSQ